MRHFKSRQYLFLAIFSLPFFVSLKTISMQVYNVNQWPCFHVSLNLPDIVFPRCNIAIIPGKKRCCQSLSSIGMINATYTKCCQISIPLKQVLNLQYRKIAADNCQLCRAVKDDSKIVIILFLSVNRNGFSDHSCGLHERRGGGDLKRQHNSSHIVLPGNPYR